MTAPGSPGQEAQAVAGRKLPVGGLIRVLAVGLFVAAIAAQSPSFINVLALSAIWGVAAVGLGLVLGTAGQISLCQASFVLAGAYCYATVTVEWGHSTLLGMGAAIVGGGLLALVVSPVLRARGNYLALATITVALLVDRGMSTGDWVPGGNSGIAGIPYFAVLGFTIDSPEKYLALSLSLLAVIVPVLYWRYGRGKVSRAVQALHHDEAVLAGFGGRPSLLKREVFVVGGLLAGLSGGLYAGAFGFVSTNGFGLFESFALALAVFVGGNGRLIGALFGALIYQGSFYVLGDQSDFRFALLGLIVILTVYFFPQGLWPSVSDFAGWLPTRDPRPQAPDSGPSEATSVEPLGLSVEGLTKRYGALEAVSELNVSFAAGSITALIGPNGAGKTTLLDLVAGEQDPSEGAVLIDGVDVAYSSRAARARSGITRTYQRLRLIPSLSVLQNVMIGVDEAVRSDRLVTERSRRAFAAAALADVGLHRMHDAPVGSLTFGQRRLVEMARAIASRPRLVLLDEPSSGLNDAEAREFADVVRQLHRTGCTVVIVEHNLPFVRSLAHDIVALDHGRLLAKGSTEEVFAAAEFQRAYVGEGPRARTEKNVATGGTE